MGTQAPAPTYGTQPMKPAQGKPGKPGVKPGQVISAQICPVTGGPHAEKKRPGVIGLVIGIVFCPIGCIA
jgi:hypothetical protein